MTYQEFKNKYNGKYADYDGYYGAQCWDLAQKYFTEVLGVPSWVLSGCGNVCNMLVQPKLNDLLLYFDEVSPTNLQAGDVAIWSANHIAIVDHWDGKDMWYFSQNPNECKVMIIYMNGLRTFRLKSKFKPVTRDENKNQIEVKVPQLNCRVNPSIGAESIGFAKQGIHNYTDKANADGYDWYLIGEGWIAYTSDWCNLYPKKVENPSKIENNEENGQDSINIPTDTETSENEQENEKKGNVLFKGICAIIDAIVNLLKKLFKVS